MTIEGWSHGRLKWDAKLVAGGTPSTEEVDYWLEGDDPDGVPFVAISDMSRRTLVRSTAKSLSSDGMLSRNMPLGTVGTILLAMYASVGETAFLDIEATWNQALLGISPDPLRADPRFIYYVLLAKRESLLADVRSNTQANLNAGQVGDLWYLRPQLEDQRAIADYLDRETAQIDTLIAKQERLISTLRERRLASITAETQGSGRTAYATTSDWYPELPEAWRLGRVKSVSRRVTDGAHISPDTVNGMFAFVSTRDVKNGRIDLEGCLRTSQETYAYMVRTGCQPRKGDVLFSKDGTVGETAVVTEDKDFVVASSLVIISPNLTQTDADFLSYALTSKTAQDQAVSMMRGAGLPRLSVANLARLELPLPPLSEQRSIASRLNTITKNLDTLIAKAERFIELSKERRAALITAAVTGQIDVPGGAA